MDEYILWIVIGVLVFAVITLNSAIKEDRENINRIRGSLENLDNRLTGLELSEAERMADTKKHRVQ